MKLCKHDLEEIRQLKALKKILKNSSKGIDKQKKKCYNNYNKRKEVIKYEI